MNKIHRLLTASILSLLGCLHGFAQASSNTRTGTLAERLGYPANSRLLVIHADDFGMSHSVNRAIMEALEKHWVTSASVMVPCPWFPEAAHWAQVHSDADIGLHITLNSDWTTYRWGPVSPQSISSSLLDANGYLPLTTQNVAIGAKPADLEIEAQAQIEKALSLGIHLSHLDPHMGTMTSTAELSKIYIGLGVRHGLPVLLQRRDIGIWNDLQIGIRTKHYGMPPPPESVVLDAVVQIMPGVPKLKWLDAYKKMLALLPSGAYQLVVHLGYDDAEMQGATSDHPHWGSAWRQNDFDMVRSPEFQQFVKDQGFILLSWKDLTKALQGQSSGGDQTSPK
jgi:chitin disaccharide deacetylase